MRKLVFFIILILISFSLSAQNTFKYEIRANGGLRIGGISKIKIDSISYQNGRLRFYNGSTQLILDAPSGMIYPSGSGIPTINNGSWGTTIVNNSAYWNAAEPGLGNPDADGYMLTSTRSGIRTWIAPPSGGSGMIYPSGSGIAVVNNGAWGTTITNNSSNWNTAYSERLRWDGGSTGLNASTARVSLALNNVTNESKATMFTNPQFTGTAVRWGTDTLATRAYARSSGGGGGLTATDVGNQIHDSIANGVQLGDVAVLIADTADMLAPYALLSEVGSGGVSEATVRQIVGDTIAERLRTAVPGLRLQDSTGNKTGNYMTRAGTTAMVNTREAALGNPSTSGYILSSTAAGVRSWIAPPSGSMVYPSGSGIPTVNSGVWGTTIVDNSANWNTSYGWGNHRDAGYFVGTNATIRQLFSESVTGLTYTDSTGVLSLTSGYLIPTTTQASAWNDAATNFRSAAQVGAQIGDSLRSARNEDSKIGPLFVFGIGSGHISDTALFNNGRIAGGWHNSGQDTLYVTEVRGVLVEGTGTETITCDVMWDVSRGSATATHLVATGLTITSTTTGTVLTSFSNNMILPGRWVWCTLSGASANNKPTMLILQLTGYKRNRSN